MTVALCLECGRLKAWAWKPCPTCHYQPRGVEALAKAIIVSDHWIPPDVLKQFSLRRQQGEPFVFDPDVVELFKEQVVRVLPLTPDGELREMEESRPPPVTVSSPPSEHIQSPKP